MALGVLSSASTRSRTVRIPHSSEQYSEMGKRAALVHPGLLHGSLYDVRASVPGWVSGATYESRTTGK